MGNNMEQFRLLVDLFASITEAFYFHRIAIACFDYKKKYSEWIIIILVLCSGLMSHFGNRGDVFVWGTVMMIIEVFFFMLCCLKGNSGVKIIVLFISFLGLGFNDMLVFLLYLLISQNVDAFNMVQFPFLRAIITIITKLTLMLYLYVFIRISKKRKRIPYEINTAEKLVLFFVWIGFICLISSFYYVDSNYYFVLFSIVGVFFLIEFKIYDWVRRRIDETQTDILLYKIGQQNQQMYHTHFRRSLSIYDRLKELRHDMKHHVSYMNYLLQEEKYKELQEYLGEIEHGK